MLYGLTKEDWDVIIKILDKNRRVEKAILYGSRAKGCNKPFSDVDITLKGRELEFSDLLSISGDFDESNLPFFFDVSIYGRIKNQALIDHINRCGKVIYERREGNGEP